MTDAAKDLRYGPIVARCRSAREREMVYEVRQKPGTDTFSCNCAGWGVRKTCRHVEAAAATVTAGGGVVMTKGDAVTNVVRTNSRDDTQRQRDERSAQNAANEIKARITAQIVKPATRKVDGIAEEAQRVAREILAVYRLGSAELRISLLVADAIRKFAGAAPAPMVKASMPVQQGVREIVLDD